MQQKPKHDYDGKWPNLAVYVFRFLTTFDVVQSLKCFIHLLCASNFAATV